MLATKSTNLDELRNCILDTAAFIIPEDLQNIVHNFYEHPTFYFSFL